MRKQISEKFPTGGLAMISFEADRWAGVSSGSGRLERFVTPRVLAAALSNHE
jgi:phosphohistidine phosphatase